MTQLFAVTRRRGAAWDPALPMERQADWRDHADFMNALEAAGFVALGGPLGESGEILLIVRAEDEAEIEERLAGDPWSAQGLLSLVRILPWSLRLGRLD